MKSLNKSTAENIAEAVKKELNEDMQVSVMIRGRVPVIPDFVMMFQEVMKRIVVGEGLSLITYRVFCFMVASMEFQNFIGIDIKTMAEDLKVSVPSVDRAMKQLKELNIIISIKDTLDRRRNAYMLNPLAGWKGKARNYVSVVKKMKNLQTPGQLKLFPEQILIVPEANQEN